MKDRIFLLLYAVAVVVATSIHSLWLLAAMFACALMLSGRKWRRLIRNSFIAVALFTSVVLIAYTAATLYHGSFSGRYVLLITLRVWTLTFMTMLIGQRINLFRAFGFSKTLLYAVTLATSQVLTMRRMFGEFRYALKSRTIKKPKAKDLYRHGAATAGFFINKSVGDATEIAQAMKSRGFFND
jgi:cobalt/nickel transport system permease protein